tara:strand:- start:1358 stop:1756 length:399 start_codon:yes stop_codon:yes gene_type:complete
MAKYLEAATQCTLLTDVSQHNQENCSKMVIDSDDKEECSLSSLLTMFGIRYNRVTRSTIDSIKDLDSPTNNRKNPILRRRVVPIDIDKQELLQKRRNLLLSQNLCIDQQEKSIWSDIDEPDTPTSPYKHPWL